MKIKRKQKILIAAGVCLGLIILGFLGLKLAPSCPVQEEIKTVRGNSLEPLVPSGSQITALVGYYACHEIRRGDLVLYHYSGDKFPLLKIVKAVPQDTFQLVPKDTGGYHMFINGKVVTNSQDVPYEFSGNKYRMLSLYERDYNQVIPLNAYLLLGNQSNGSVDASVFGLVDKSSILGKAVVKK
jgi:signal peptidase I